jgi:hypothetical protein
MLLLLLCIYAVRLLLMLVGYGSRDRQHRAGCFKQAALVKSQGKLLQNGHISAQPHDQ